MPQQQNSRVSKNPATLAPGTMKSQHRDEASEGNEVLRQGRPSRKAKTALLENPTWGKKKRTSSTSGKHARSASENDERPTKKTTVQRDKRDCDPKTPGRTQVPSSNRGLFEARHSASKADYRSTQRARRILSRNDDDSDSDHNAGHPGTGGDSDSMGMAAVITHRSIDNHEEEEETDELEEEPEENGYGREYDDEADALGDMEESEDENLISHNRQRAKEAVCWGEDSEHRSSSPLPEFISVTPSGSRSHPVATHVSTATNPSSRATPSRVTSNAKARNNNAIAAKLFNENRNVTRVTKKISARDRKRQDETPQFDESCDENDGVERRNGVTISNDNDGDISGDDSGIVNSVALIDRNTKSTTYRHPSHTEPYVVDGRLNMGEQTEEIQASLTRAVEHLVYTLTYVSPLPESQAATKKQALAAIIVRVTDDQAIVERIEMDRRFCNLMVAVLSSRVSLFRKSIKDITVGCIAVGYGLVGRHGKKLPTHQVQAIVQSLLGYESRYRRFTFDLEDSEGSLPKAIRSRPYRHHLFAEILAKAYFATGTSIGNQYPQELKSSWDAKPYEDEIPIPMLGMVAASLHAILMCWNSGRYIATNFSADFIAGLYTEHVSALELLKKKAGDAKFHKLRSGILKTIREDRPGVMVTATNEGQGADNDDDIYAVMSE
ncbi:hypothetical protein BXZ70DRAFT_1065199 [Cristinia sonorae]|uniref:DUF6532 domain-containing protein n=1 Tax=Cristinia sonorae TaxID=1940300 RepID=A0A8K0UNR0_9AGAR|nr:hypothetical protein BXZ70DRAFT_1065199 [Cristinia sonorae]